MSALSRCGYQNTSLAPIASEAGVSKRQNLRHLNGRLRFGLNDLYEETYTLQAALFQRGQDEGSLRSSINTRYLAVTYQGAVDAMLAYLDSYLGTDAEAGPGSS